MWMWVSRCVLAPVLHTVYVWTEATEKIRVHDMLMLDQKVACQGIGFLDVRVKNHLQFEQIRHASITHGDQTVRYREIHLL